MQLKPMNRHLLIQLVEDDPAGPENSHGILLPKEYKPKQFLFEGTGGKYTYSSLRNISHKYLDINPHIISHSYATSLVESKENLRTIQLVLGHKNSKTTEIYTHVSKDILNEVNSPI